MSEIGTKREALQAKSLTDSIEVLSLHNVDKASGEFFLSSEAVVPTVIIVSYSGGE